MNDTELLQAIRQIVKEEVDPVKQDVTSLKAGQESLQRDVSGLKGGHELLQQEVAGLTAGQEALKQAQIMTDIHMEKGQKFLQQQVTKTNIILENDISQKLSALFDAHALDSEKIDHIVETVDTINNDYAATDVVTRVNAEEIKKIKEKIG